MENALKISLLLFALTYSSCATSPQQCAIESPQSCRMQGIQHQTGRGAVQDPKLAESYFRTGCLGGDSESCWELGLELWNQESTQESKAVFAYNCKNGHAKSCDFINELDKKHESALKEARSLVSASIPLPALGMGEAEDVFSDIEPFLKTCFKKSLIETKLVVDMRVDESGNVGILELEHNVQGSDVGPFLNCVRPIIEGLDFPPQQRAVLIKKTFVFELLEKK